MMTQKGQFELLIGPSGEYYYFKEEIARRISQSTTLDYDFIYFLPVKRSVRYLKEQLVETSPNGVLADPPIYTFYEFMVQFYRSYPKARKVISPAMRLFLVEEILKKGIPDLRFFSSISATRKGLVRKVDELLSELREYGYTAQELLSIAEEGDERIHDFSTLIDAFEALLGPRLTDEAGAIREVITRLDPVQWRKKFSRVKVVYMSGYGLFTRPMFEFFKAVRNFCHIKIKLDYLPKHPHLFAHAEPAYEMLQTLNPTVIQDKKSAPWETRLFNRRVWQEKLSLPGKDILIQPAGKPEEEVAFIASYVKRLHHYLSIPLHQIGITFPSLEKYAPLIREIFPRYGLPDNGLPYNLSTGFQLSQSPLIRSFLLLLEVPMQHYEIKKFLQLITSPFYRPREAEKLDPAAIKLLGRELRLLNLQGNWQEDLKKHLGFLEGRIAEEALEDDFELERLRERVRILKEVAPKLQSILEALQTLRQKQTVQNFRRHYLDLLEKLGFLDWYKLKMDLLSPQEKEQEYRAFNRFIKLLEQFSWIVSNMHGEQALTLKEFYQYLSLLVSQAAYNVREWPRYGLQIMPRLEIMAINPKVLIFGGMVEGDFPRPFTHDIFFNDEKREQMGLAATEDLLAQDKYIFYQVLKCSAERIIFTYPQFKKEAALVPSNFLNALADQLQVRWRRHRPSKRFLQNQQDLVEQTARHIPGGIQPIDIRNLKRWIRLNDEEPSKIELARFWLQRVQVNYLKRRRDTFNEYEGILARFPEIISALQEQFADHPFSITRLETFAFCPIQFYFRHLLNLEEEEDLEPGLTPLERGQLVHNTLFRFYRRLRERNLHSHPWTEAALLNQIAAEEFDQLPFRGLLFDLEREKYFGSENRPGLWEEFLAVEAREISALQFYPAYFEAAFGRAGRKSEQDPVSIPEPILLKRNGKTVKIIGKIDRIDIDPEGRALLLDYKTGSAAPRVTDVQAGVSLQLPIYAVALTGLLKPESGEKAVQPVMIAIYRVKDAENCLRIPVMFDIHAELNMKSKGGMAALPNQKIIDADGYPLTFGDMLDRAEAHLFDYVERIRSGHFRHTRYPEEAACAQYCEFRRICRKDVQKLQENRQLHLEQDS